MVVIVNKYMPALDLAIKVMDEIASKRKSKVVTSQNPRAIELIADLDALVYQLYPLIDIRIKYKKRAGNRTHYNYIEIEGRGERKKTLEIELKDLDFSLEQENYVTTTILESVEKNKGCKISVDAENNFKEIRKESKFVKALKENFDLAEPTYSTRIEFHYMFASPFVINLPYQKFEEKGRNKKIIIYPVSKEKRYKIKSPAWEFISMPIYWRAISVWMGHTLKILSGNKSPEEISTITGLSKDNIKRLVRKMEDKCFLLLESINRKDISYFLNEVSCPNYMKKRLLEVPLKILKFYEESNKEYFNNLIEWHKQYKSKN